MMAEKKRKLLLITEAFPFGFGEPFLIAEFPYLVEEFFVTVVSLDTTSPLEKEIPSGVSVIRLNVDLSPFGRIKHFFRFLVDGACRLEVKQIVHARKDVLKRCIQSLNMYSSGMEWFSKLSQLPEFSEQDIIYSYWYNDKIIGTALSLRKSKQRPVLVTRTHGYDLYNERRSSGRQPFKSIADNYLDHIFFVSRAGYSYYESTFGFQSSCAYSVARLGTINTFGVKDTPRCDGFLLVSCSNVIPLKRLDLLIDALALVEFPNAHWVHFGDGEAMEEIVAYAEKKLGQAQYCTYEFLGRVTNEEIHRYYQTNIVDCFIITSASEGAPVSIQEALSYGIPIIGTSVGGIPEMIEDCGILLSSNPEPVEVYEAISTLKGKKDTGEIQQLRNLSRQAWETSFDASNNFPTFAKTLLSMVTGRRNEQ